MGGSTGNVTVTKEGNADDGDVSEPEDDIRRSISSDQEKLESKTIIFCDVDGVLCCDPKNLFRLPKQRMFDDSCAIQLRRVIEATSARVVLSSSWRRKSATLSRAMELFVEHGLAREGA